MKILFMENRFGSGAMRIRRVVQRLALLSLVASIVIGADQAHAALIGGVTIEDVSSQLTSPSNFKRFAAHTIDGSGLNINGPGTHSKVPDDGAGTQWLTTGVGAFAGRDDLNPQITWDLGATYNVANMRVWNYNESDGGNTSRGIRTTDVSTSTDSLSYTPLANVGLDKSPGLDTVDFSQVVSLGDVSARFIRFNNIVNWGGSNNFVGLSEIQFDGVAVPEPTSIALSIVGFVATVGFRRHRSGFASERSTQ
jgi:hypothetical protein